ncbi:MAG: carbohydrate transporter ATP-binding protein family [Verrucomicrobiales bacterium]|nr:carbohydrate transporter ATP-binding protein family [Verrucomicrobiales bacterium]
MAAEASSIIFENVTKRFPIGKGNSVEALTDLHLSVGKGELMAITGPSGSGKTTALRLVAGLETPDSGKVLVDGLDMAPVPPHARGVSMVFQSHALYPHLSARENLAFGLEIQKLPRAEIAGRIGRVAKILGVEKILDKRPDDLSGGERQRIALGRAIVSQPRILLLDEPFSSLDPQLRTELRDEIRKLRREFGLTILLVTHDQPDALALSDRIAVIHAGRLEQVDLPEKIYRFPSNQFVASFFGEMNFLRGRVRNGIWELPLEGDQVIQIPIATVEVINLIENKDLALGFRPEAIRIVDEHSNLAGNVMVTIRVEVISSEFAGSIHRLRGKIGAETIGFNARNWIPKQFVRVDLDLSEALFFDSATGNSLKTINI